MIHTPSQGRGARYHPKLTALSSGGARSTSRELHDRVAGIAGALSRQGFGVGDRLAILLPNEHDYIELVYACAGRQELVGGEGGIKGNNVTLHQITDIIVIGAGPAGVLCTIRARTWERAPRW